MRRTTLKEKISYCFDNLMAKGMPAQAGMLFAVSLIVTIVFGSLLYVVYPDLVSTIFSGIWAAFMHMIDGGTITADEGGFWYMCFMLTVTIVGLVVTATLISIINESLSNKMLKLRKGNSRILEKNHTIILGYNQGVYTIIENLMIANESEDGGTIVIMDELNEKADMEDNIAEWIAHKKKEDKEKNREKISYSPKKYKTKIICRKGDIANKKSVAMCSPTTAKSIIVNCDDDFMTVKAVLAAAGNLGPDSYILNSGRKAPHIVAFVKDGDYKKTAELAGKIWGDDRKIYVIYVDDFISQVIANTGRQPGISNVLTEFLGFVGNELYIEQVPPALMPEKGKKHTVYEANINLDHAVVIGIKRKIDPTENVTDETKIRGYKLELNPEPMTEINADDELIILEEDNKEFLKQLPDVLVESEIGEVEASEEVKLSKRTVIFGFSSKIPKIIEETRNYLSDDCFNAFTVVFDEDKKPNKDVAMDSRGRERAKIFERIEKLGIKPEFIDLYKGEEYIKYLTSDENGDIDSVLILSDHSIDPEINDANMLGLLLRVRDFKQKNNAKFSITTEMVKNENKELAIVKEYNDFIVSEDITNKIISQISETSELYDVFDDLLSKGNAEIHMHSFNEYGDFPEEFEYIEAFKKAAKKHHTLIGYSDEFGNCVINPRKSDKIAYSATSSFIVIQSYKKNSAKPQ